MDRRGWDERYSASERTFTPEPNRFVVDEAGDLAPGRALDLGCGEGRHAVWLASLGWRVVAVDFSPVGLSRAQARARAEGRTIAFAAADVHELRLPPEAFDLVLAAFFHPEPPDRAGSYRAIAAALVPGGTFVQVGYDIANLTEGTGGPQNPQFLLRPTEIAAELDALGLCVERADTVRLRVPPHAGGQPVDVVDAVIRAVRA